MAERAREAKIDAAWVVERWRQVVERCMQAAPVLDRDGKPTGEFRFDAAGANAALRNLAQHLGMLTDRHEQVGSRPIEVIEVGMSEADLAQVPTEELVHRLEELRQRIGSEEQGGAAAHALTGERV